MGVYFADTGSAFPVKELPPTEPEPAQNHMFWQENDPPEPPPDPGVGNGRKILRKRYRCMRNKHPSKPYEFIGFGAMDVTESYKFKWPSMAPNPINP